jgi:hypothetical protein
MKNSSQHLIAEVPRRRSRVEMTIGVDLGDVWSHYCTLNQDGEVVDRGRFRTTPKAIVKWFTDLSSTRVAMEAGVHSIWISEQLQEFGHEVIVANVRELRAISHSDRKSDQVDAEKLARYARLDPEILRPISHRIVEQQETLTQHALLTVATYLISRYHLPFPNVSPDCREIGSKDTCIIQSCMVFLVYARFVGSSKKKRDRKPATAWFVSQCHRTRKGVPGV